jgi:hypothetical protein
MIAMKDLPYPKIGAEPIEYVLPDDCRLSDGKFSEKDNQTAKRGDTILIGCSKNFGYVKHEEFGIFRY